MLRRNNQPSIGTKDMLIDRIILCKKNGCMPLCTICGKSLLIFKNNKFICPGFVDENGIFIKCDFECDLPVFVKWMD